MALNNPYALSFDGVDDRVVIPNFYNTAEMTVMVHVVFAEWPTDGWIINKRDNFNDNQWQLNCYDGKLEAVLYSGGITNIGVVRYGDIVVGQVYNVCFVTSGVNGGFLRLFIDGIEVGSTTLVGNMKLGSREIVIGMAGWGSRPFKGVIDNIAIFNKALTWEERDAYKNKYLQGNEPGLAALCRFDEGSGTIVTDSSPNANHGTIYGATWVPGIVDLHLPGEVPISATLRGSSNAIAKADRIRGLSAHLTGAATSTGGTPIRIRGLSANLQGMGTVDARMNLIAALKASLQGKATLKSNILALFVPEGVYVIDADEIFSKDQPSRGQVVANHIEVWVNPLKPTDEPEEVYRSKDPVTIPAGKTETVTIQFDDEPVTEPAVALEEAGVNLSIVDTKYYAWGAEVTIKNAGSSAQTCRIVATGKPLKVQGREVVVKKDEVSIKENGLKKYTFDNPFVQDRATAELIAEKLLSFSNAKRDIVIEWRGDPALQLADVVMIPEYQRKGLDQRGIFYVTKQELEFDGGLRAKLEGRKM